MLDRAGYARYQVTYQPDQRRLQTMAPEQLFGSPQRSPQPPLWAWDEDEWMPGLRLPAYAPRRSPVATVIQPPLFALEQAEA